jgi:serine/threonine-protein kinase
MQQRRRTLAGRYELEEVIGRGGMGTVYRARDRVLGREVAVKLLPEALAAADPVRLARFEREARATASLSHRGVVAVYDAGVDDSTRYIVMELVTGRDLAAVMREQAPLEPGRAAEIAAEIAEALAAAHAAGVIHRDVKPANVMIARDGRARLLDFGVARSTGSTQLTQVSSILGTASYMAPEQASGKRADERSDIYSLGCLLYAMLTGRPPFTGDTAAAIAHQQIDRAPSPARKLNPSVPADLDALLLTMLAKEPKSRPASAAELALSLRRTASIPGELSQTRVLSRGAPRRRLGAVAGAVVAVAACATLALLALVGWGGGEGSAARSAQRTSAHRTGGALTTTKTTPASPTPARVSAQTDEPVSVAGTAASAEHVGAPIPASEGKRPHRPAHPGAHKRGDRHGHDVGAARHPAGEPEPGEGDQSD